MPKITVTAKDKSGAITSANVSYSATSNNTPTGLVPPDGGLTSPYKGKFPDDPNFFPIGVWYEAVLEQSHINLDKDAGLNTYVVLTNDSRLDLIKNANMHFAAQHETWTDNVNDPNAGVIKSWFLWDEIDMQQDSTQAFATLQGILNGLPNDGRLRQNNYGKGVMFWWGTAEAQKIVRDYTDVTGADIYWFTDNYCHQQWEGGQLHQQSLQFLFNLVQ